MSIFTPSGIPVPIKFASEEEEEKSRVKIKSQLQTLSNRAVVDKMTMAEIVSACCNSMHYLSMTYMVGSIEALVHCSSDVLREPVVSPPRSRGEAKENYRIGMETHAVDTSRPREDGPDSEGNAGVPSRTSGASDKTQIPT